MVAQRMLETPSSALTEGLPKEFTEFARYVKRLGFYDEPDYGKMRQILRDGLSRNGWENDGIFEWTR